MIPDELLARLRAVTGCEGEFAEAPVLMSGGSYTANYRFSLTGVPAPWSGSLVLRLFPTHAPAGLDAWEAAVQTFVHDRGLPAPAVALFEPEATIAGRRWFIMQRLPGSPAMAGTEPRQLVGGLPRLVRDLPRQTAEVHLALHRLDPGPLLDAFGEMATVQRWLSELARTCAGGHPLRPGYEWLRDNRPPPRSPPVLCHGDSWGGNLLVDHATVTALIDWSLAVVAEPALDVGFLTAAWSLAPGVPGRIQRIAQLVGRRLAAGYRASYESGSEADLQAVPYYQALRCLLELNDVVAYRAAVSQGLSYDGPRPAWDGVAAGAVAYFKRRTGVALQLPRR